MTFMAISFWKYQIWSYQQINSIVKTMGMSEFTNKKKKKYNEARRESKAMLTTNNSAVGGGSRATEGDW